MAHPVKGQPVLVTGGTGFIGSHLCRRLAREGARVHVLARSPREAWRLADVADSLVFHGGDMADKAALAALVASLKPQCVYHLAADLNADRDPALLERMMRSNAEGTFNVAEACLTGVGRFVYAGTCEEYGVNPPPFREDMRECPVSPYSLSKVIGTQACLMLRRTQGLPAVVARPFLTYGPAQNAGMMIPSLIRACLDGKALPMTKGEQTREFNYVDDIVDGLLALFDAPSVEGEIINLGNGKEITIRDAATLVVRLTGSKVSPAFGAIPYREAESMRFYSDSGKARRLLKWESRTSLEDGLTKTINWYRENRP